MVPWYHKELSQPNLHFRRMHRTGGRSDGVWRTAQRLRHPHAGSLSEGPDTALSGRFCRGARVFGYHWVDDNHLALYLIDVTGHGLDAALLSVSVANVIRTGALPGV